MKRPCEHLPSPCGDRSDPGSALPGAMCRVEAVSRRFTACNRRATR